MKPLDLSANGIYHLRRLSQAVQEETGVRHRLSDPMSVMKLLRYSSTSPMEEVFNCFAAFLVELDTDQQAYLRSEGLLLPPVIIQKDDMAAQSRMVG